MLVTFEGLALGLGFRIRVSVEGLGLKADACVGCSSRLSAIPRLRGRCCVRGGVAAWQQQRQQREFWAGGRGGGRKGKGRAGGRGGEAQALYFTSALSLPSLPPKQVVSEILPYRRTRPATPSGDAPMQHLATPDLPSTAAPHPPTPIRTSTCHPRHTLARRTSMRSRVPTFTRSTSRICRGEETSPRRPRPTFRLTSSGLDRRRTLSSR
jgi:hypothetical protein